MVFTYNIIGEIVSLNNAHKFLVVANVGVVYGGSHLVIVKYSKPNLPDETLFSSNFDACTDWLTLFMLKLNKRGFIV